MRVTLLYSAHGQWRSGMTGGSIIGGAARRIAFLHIPKTAGRSVYHAFEQALGEAQCREFVPVIDAASFEGARFVSAHTQLSAITADAFVFTFLRNPLEQISSHLSWIDRYNRPVFHEELALLSPGIHRIIERLGQADFRSAQSIGAFLEWLPEHAETRLFNVQCEALAARADRQVYANEREMQHEAVLALRQLDFVGVTERMGYDLTRLFRRVGIAQRPVVTRQNLVTSTRRVDLSDPEMAAVLSRAVSADLGLYQHVLERRWDRTLARMSEPAYRTVKRVRAGVRRVRSGVGRMVRAI